MSEDRYRLWSFLVGNRLIIARGRTQQEATNWLLGKIGDKPSPRNLEVHVFPINLVDAARLYTTNHPFDWLTIPPGHGGIRPAKQPDRVSV